MTALTSLGTPVDRAVDIDEAVTRARQLGQPALYSRVERLPFAPDAIAFLDASSAALGSGTLWEHPGAGLAFAGAGRHGRPMRQDRSIRSGFDGGAGLAGESRSR